MVDTKTAEIFAESGVRLRQFSPPREGLVDLAGGDGDGFGTVVLGDVRDVLGDEGFVRPIGIGK